MFEILSWSQICVLVYLSLIVNLSQLPNLSVIFSSMIWGENRCLLHSIVRRNEAAC